MKFVTFLWGRACKQIWLHFSRGGAWKQIWVPRNYAKNYLLNFFREESGYAIANKSACSIIYNGLCDSLNSSFSAKKAKYSGKQKLRIKKYFVSSSRGKL